MYDEPGSGLQVHDFSPGNGENIHDPDPIFHLPGLFWLVRLDDGDFVVTGNVAVLNVSNLVEFDRFQAFGPGNVPMHLSFDTTYVKSGAPTIIVPRTNDPLSPFNWAGEMWNATAKGSFSASYDDKSWSVTGTMDSALMVEGAPGHMGHERNGAFALP